MHEMADRRACGQELLHEAEELPEAEEQDGGVLEAIASEYEAVFTQLNSLIKDQNDRIADRLSQFLPKEPADEEEGAREYEQIHPEQKDGVPEEPEHSEITGLTFR